MPIKYDLLQGMAQSTLQARIAVLRIFADLFFNSHALMSILSTPSDKHNAPAERCRDILRAIIPRDRKETWLNDVLKATMNTQGEYGSEVRCTV